MTAGRAGVEAIVANNGYHHLGIARWRERCTNARCFAAPGAIERIRKFEVMAEPFSVENGLMTPTLKLRRPRIIEHHGALLEGLYAAGK